MSGTEQPSRLCLFTSVAVWSGVSFFSVSTVCVVDRVRGGAPLGLWGGVEGFCALQ